MQLGIGRLTLLLIIFAFSKRTVFGQDVDRHSTSLSEIMVQKFYVTDTSGVSIPLNSVLKSNAVVAINFWATWCSPCRKEIPNLINLYSLNHEDGLTVIGHCTEPYESKASQVKEFVKKNKISYRSTSAHLKYIIS